MNNFSAIDTRVSADKKRANFVFPDSYPDRHIF